MEPLIGEIRIFCGTFNIKGWGFCDGTAYSARRFPELFRVIGYTYGGQGDMFNVPDFKGRVGIGTGNRPGLSTYNLAQTGGAAGYSLTTDTMPAHTHDFLGTTATVAAMDPTNAIEATAAGRTERFADGAGNVSGALHTDAVATTGLGTPISNMQASMPFNYLICVSWDL